MWTKKRMYAELNKRIAVLEKSVKGRLLQYDSVHEANFKPKKKIEIMENEATNAKLNAVPSTLY